MANSLKRPLDNTVILVNKSVMPVKWRTITHRAAKVLGGEGTDPNTTDDRLICRFYFDGDSMSISGSEVDSVLAEQAEDFDYEQWCKSMGRDSPDTY